MSREKLIAYALDYASFLLGNLEKKEVSNINNIILFGSTARGDFDEHSDVDVFVDVSKKNKTENSVKTLTKGFFDSVKFKEYWLLMGIERNIKPIVGRLDEWRDLKESIVVDGIVLYGKFREFPRKSRPMILFQWESIRDDSKRVLLNKRLFGYRQYGKRYEGALGSTGGEKLGSNCILIPIEHHRRVREIFRDMKIDVKVRDVIT